MIPAQGGIARAAELLRGGRHLEASRELQSVLVANPHDADALQLLGLAYKHLGQLDAARDAMVRSLALNPAQPHVLNNLGGVFLRRREFANAKRCFEEAAKDQHAKRDALGNLAIAERGLGDLEAAERAARDAMILDANFATAHNVLGQILLERGQSEEATLASKRATELAPKSPDAWRNFGAALHHTSRSREAVPAFEKAIALRPRAHEAHAFLGVAKQALGDIEGARKAYRQAVTIAPDYEDAHFALSQLLWTSGDKTAYLDSYKEALERLPASANIRCAYALTLMMVERHQEAERVLREATRHDRTSVRAAALLGDVLSQRGAHDEAMRLLGALQTQTAQYPTVRIGYARALLRGGAYAEALAQLDACERTRLHAFDLDQEIIALTYVAARFAGDDRAQRLFDYQKLVRSWEIPTPPGFANLHAFNQALKERLDALHTTQQAPLEQTLHAGTQTYGRLFNNPDPLIQALRRSCAALTERYLAELPDLGAHPFMEFRPLEARFAGSWSVRLNNGFHKNHFHGKGWLSSAYYVSLPGEMSRADNERSGWLKFGQPHTLPGADEQPEFWVRPEEGVLALFPSYMWHGTERFASAEPRITVAFDTQSSAPTPGQLGAV
jgi:Flp pilus assembly protein TadD